MEKNLQLFKYSSIDNTSYKTLVLLHGTGGNEHDFLFLNNLLEMKYNILSLRGNIDEEGMNRFFRRHAFGVFDQENIAEETEKLKHFLETWMKKQKTRVENLMFLGYSNGANMILATLFRYPTIIKHAVLLHPMLPFEPKKLLDLSSRKFFVSYGKYDQMVSPEENKKVIKALESLGAKLETKEYPSGHEISDAEMKDVVKYLHTFQ